MLIRLKLIFILVKTTLRAVGQVILMYRFIVVPLAIITMVMISQFLKQLKLAELAEQLETEKRQWHQIQQLQPNSQIINQYVEQLNATKID